MCVLVEITAKIPSTKGSFSVGQVGVLQTPRKTIRNNDKNVPSPAFAMKDLPGNGKARR